KIQTFSSKRQRHAAKIYGAVYFLSRSCSLSQRLRLCRRLARLGHHRTEAIPTKLPPRVMVCSLALRPAKATRPLVLTRSTPTPPAPKTPPLVVTRSDSI